MFPVYFYRFIKDENSTSKPGSHADFTHCEFKEASDILNPTLVIDVSGLNTTGTFTHIEYNYCYLPHTDRYYFIRNWTQVNVLWECQLEVDVLASFKTLIGDSSQYVTRCSHVDDVSVNKLNANYVTDTMFPVETIPKTVKTGFTSSLMNYGGNDFSNGLYIVGIISNSKSTSSMGAVDYYSMTHSNFGTFIDCLFRDTDWMNGSLMEVSQELLETLFNPLQYVVSCWWYPFSNNGKLSGTSVDTINLGWWKIENIAATRISTFTLSEKDTVTVPLHPLSEYECLRYVVAPPYSLYTLFYPGFGTLNIPDYLISEKVNSRSINDDLTVGDYVQDVTLNVNLILDVITGQCELSVDGVFLASSICGCPVLLGQEKTGLIPGVISGALSGVGGLVKNAFSGSIGSAITNGVNGVRNALDSISAEVTTKGSVGSFIAHRSDNTPYILATFRTFDYAPAMTKLFGHSHCKIELISGIPGYIEVAHPSLYYIKTSDPPKDGTQTPTFAEIEKIKNHMTSGFYYEE